MWKFGPDPEAVNYNPELEEYPEICDYSGECIYDDDMTIVYDLDDTPYYLNELKFVLDFIELNDLFALVFGTFQLWRHLAISNFFQNKTLTSP